MTRFTDPPRFVDPDDYAKLSRQIGHNSEAAHAAAKALRREIDAFLRGPARILGANLEERGALEAVFVASRTDDPLNRIGQFLDRIEDTIMDCLNAETVKALEEIDG